MKKIEGHPIVPAIIAGKEDKKWSKLFKDIFVQALNGDVAARRSGL